MIKFEALPNMFLLNLEWCMQVQCHLQTCALMSLLSYKPGHISLVYKCPSKNSDHISPTYFRYNSTQRHFSILDCGIARLGVLACGTLCPHFVQNPKRICCLHALSNAELIKYQGSVFMAIA